MKRKASPATSDAYDEKLAATFFHAVRDGHVRKVRQMVNDGDVKDLNATLVSFDDRNALTIASSEGHVDVVRALLELGANVNVGEQPLGGRDQQKRCWSLDLKENRRNAPLTRAVEGGYDEVVKVLVEAGADLRSIECVDAFIRLVQLGPCTYYNARRVRKSVPSVVGALIDVGMNVDAMGTDGVLALTVSVENDDEAMTRLLLEKGADVNA